LAAAFVRTGQRSHDLGGFSVERSPVATGSFDQNNIHLKSQEYIGTTSTTYDNDNSRLFNCFFALPFGRHAFMIIDPAFSHDNASQKFWTRIVLIRDHGNNTGKPTIAGWIATMGNRGTLVCFADCTGRNRRVYVFGAERSGVVE
jgi:hypothetical protein